MLGVVDIPVTCVLGCVRVCCHVQEELRGGRVGVRCPRRRRVCQLVSR